MSIKWNLSKCTMRGISLVLAATVLLTGCTNQHNSNNKTSPSSTAASSPPAATNEESVTPSVTDSNLSLRIHINQMGYLPDGNKVVIVASDEAFSETELKVRDDKDKSVVWEGKLPAARQDTNSGDWVAQIDLTDLSVEGEYKVLVAGNESVPFAINKKVYTKLFEDVAHSYTLQRSGQEIDDPRIGLKLVPGHLQDKNATVFFADEKGDKPIVDVNGGWYDAGDYGKYIPPAAVTVGQLMLAYELRPDFFAEHTFLLAPNREYWKPKKEAPDILIEVKYELDWMLRMQRDDGAVYHKVSGGAFPGFISPAEDVMDRTIYGLSSYGTAMFAAATAMGARIYERYDAAYAAVLLKHSLKAQTWLDHNPKALFRTDEGQDSGSGPYDKHSDREERFWALAELLKTTGEPKYEQAIQEHYADLQSSHPAFLSWGNTKLLGQWAVATAAIQPSAGRDAATQAIIQGADTILAQVEEDGYRSALLTEEYTWASNKNALAKGEILLLANELKANAEYVHGAADQLHYVLGRNAMGISYVTGAGDRHTLHPHHRISASTGVLVPGLLVGGPNRSGQDPALKRVVDQGVAPAKSYIDSIESYASNEYAIDYNAPLFFTLAFLDELK